LRNTIIVLDLSSYPTFLNLIQLLIAWKIVYSDSYKFLSSRTHMAHMMKRNPREVTWTVLYRRKHKKGLEEETAKKRNKRTNKFQRAVVGATLQDIMA
jgi:hypothetical protein